MAVAAAVVEDVRTDLVEAAQEQETVGEADAEEGAGHILVVHYSYHTLARWSSLLDQANQAMGLG